MLAALGFAPATVLAAPVSIGVALEGSAPSNFALDPLDAVFRAYNLPLFDSAWTCLDDDGCD